MRDQVQEPESQLVAPLFSNHRGGFDVSLSTFELIFGPDVGSFQAPGVPSPSVLAQNAPGHLVS